MKKGIDRVMDWFYDFLSWATPLRRSPFYVSFLSALFGGSLIRVGYVLGKPLIYKFGLVFAFFSLFLVGVMFISVLTSDCYQNGI